VMGLFGLGLGAIMRSTAAGISSLAALIFVLPPIITLLPSSTANAISPYLPSNAGGAVWTIHPDPNTLAPWTGLALFAGYAALSLVIAAVLLVRRDT
jgi:ABC-2 type transport system permease protein